MHFLYHKHILCFPCFSDSELQSAAVSPGGVWWLAVRDVGCPGFKNTASLFTRLSVNALV